MMSDQFVSKNHREFSSNLETLSVLSYDEAACSGSSQLCRHQHQLLHDVGQTDRHFAFQKDETKMKKKICLLNVK